MKRRDFIKNTAILGAALPLAPALLAKNSDNPPRIIKSLDLYEVGVTRDIMGTPLSRLPSHISCLIIDDPLAPREVSPDEIRRVYESMNDSPVHINCRYRSILTRRLLTSA